MRSWRLRFSRAPESSVQAVTRWVKCQRCRCLEARQYRRIPSAWAVQLATSNSRSLWFFEKTVNIWVLKTRVAPGLDAPGTLSIKAPALAAFALARQGGLPVGGELAQPGNFLYLRAWFVWLERTGQEQPSTCQMFRPTSGPLSLLKARSLRRSKKPSHGLNLRKKSSQLGSRRWRTGHDWLQIHSGVV